MTIKTRHHVTDHAVLRHLELVEGVDIAALRRAIGAKVDAAGEDHDGFTAVLIDGLRYRVRDGAVVTVEQQNKPQAGKPNRGRLGGVS